MNKKFLARVAATILATGLATTGVIAGSLGPANAARDGQRYHWKAPTSPITVDDSGTGSGGVLRTDTGWG
ncbi:hypothetical protein ABIE44_001700 [Marmoricola sp. OAE513]|uniref:hypothetical protein n=1 Tax=Marmoricola sp. OAE513 TaxID=2817894 RepID=UPI001AE9E2F7